MAVDYEILAKGGMSADQLANIFLEEYFVDKDICYPINPFQILTDLGIPFVLRPFNKYEGIYIPAVDEDDFPIIGINLKRPIVRQRFTAAHELCHHLKDVNSGFMCAVNSKSEIERYAENFASELLMPTTELRKQVQKYEQNGYIDLDGVLKVADYFGVSFQSCLFKIAYRLHKISGDTDPDKLRKKAGKYRPMIKRKEKDMYDTFLYEQLLNAIGDNFNLKPTEYACQKFKTEYIFHDSRLEGIDIDQLFSTAPCPEFGGRYRESNTLVLGAKFETVDYQKIPEEMYFLDKDIKILMDTYDKMPLSTYIKEVIRIHHRLTVIHAFRDGNGRTTRAFANMMLLKRHISPVFFKDKEKEDYKEALKTVDTTGSYDLLYESFFKSILNSFAALTDFSM